MSYSLEVSKYTTAAVVKKVKKHSTRRSLLPQEMPTDDHLNVLKKAFQCYCEGNAVSYSDVVNYYNGDDNGRLV